jgi:hypothetical protein
MTERACWATLTHGFDSDPGKCAAEFWRVVEATHRRTRIQASKQVRGREAQQPPSAMHTLDLQVDVHASPAVSRRCGG